jgi:predicted MPP superfamily phosphohydrolase
MRRPERLRDRFALAVLVVGFLLGLYAWGVEPYWIEVTRHFIQAPLSVPLKVAHISDLHTYGLGRRERALLALVEKEKADVIVVTGDNVIDGDLFGPELGQRDDPSYARASEVLGRLQAPLGVWTVRGNWENVRSVADEQAFYAGHGVRLLLNEAHELRPGVWLVGLNDTQSGPDPAGAARSIPSGAFVIVLFHSPAYFETVAGKWPIALAGHTHGGQIRLPFLSPLWLPEGSGRFVAGWYESKGSRLYVSRGIGTAMLPLRFLSRPELAVITLGESGESVK